MILYGIPTCDTCRKALKALTEAGHEARLRDVRAEPLTAAEREVFLAKFGTALINRSSTTWRNLPESERSVPADELLSEHPTLMKRPVIRDVDALYLGWGKDVQAALLGATA